MISTTSPATTRTKTTPPTVMAALPRYLSIRGSPDRETRRDSRHGLTRRPRRRGRSSPPRASTRRGWSAGSLHEDPRRPEERKRDQPDERCRGDQRGVADLPAEQDAEAAEPDERRQPVADRDPAEQHARAEDRPDGGRVRALQEALDVGVRAVPHEYRRGDQDQKKGGKEDPHGRDGGTPEAGDEVAHERRRNDHRPRAQHAHRHRDEKLALVEHARPDGVA